MTDHVGTLALDLGTTTGFAWRGANGVTISGTWNMKPQRFEGGGMRYLRFREYLDRCRKTNPLKAVYFEEVRRHRGTDAAHVYGGLLGVLSGWCEEHWIPYQGAPVGEIKKFWTGKGNATKEMMIAKCLQLGYDPIDDNEADAIAILALKTAEFVPIFPTSDR